MNDNGVSKAVFIQTSTYYGFDNKYVIESANTNKDWVLSVK